MENDTPFFDFDPVPQSLAGLEGNALGPWGTVTLYSMIIDEETPSRYDGPTVPPPLSRRRPISLPSNPVSVHSVLSPDHPVAMWRLWDVRTCTRTFDPCVYQTEGRVVPPHPFTISRDAWREQNATIPARSSITIRVEGLTSVARTWVFEVASSSGEPITVQDILKTVHAQCAQRAGSASRSPASDYSLTGHTRLYTETVGKSTPVVDSDTISWRWGGLRESITGSGLWVLKLGGAPA